MDNTQNQNSTGMMNGIPPVPSPEKKIGPIVGTLIIVLVLIIAALYFFSQRLNTTSSADITNQTPTSNPNTANVSSSPSTDSASIEADLNAQLQDVDYSF